MRSALLWFLVAAGSAHAQGLDNLSRETVALVTCAATNTLAAGRLEGTLAAAVKSKAQKYATLARWFGVTDEQLMTILVAFKTQSAAGTVEWKEIADAAKQCPDI
jgi:hypothetical protein